MPHLRIIFLILLPGITSQLLHGHPSWGIQVDRHGNIYFADIANNQRGSLWKLDKNGQLELLLSDFHAHNVVLDTDGYPISAHGEGEHTMVRYRSEGQLDTLYQAFDYRQFNGGNATWSPQWNILFQAEHYVWQITPEGRKVRFNEHYLEWNQTIYVDEEGLVYVPEIGDGRGRIYRLQYQGEVQLLADQLITKYPDRSYNKHDDVLLGITKGCDQQLYICETAGRRVIKIDELGQSTTFYRAADGWTPCGLDFFQGDAYILEYPLEKAMRGPRIVKINEQGQQQVLFNYEAYSREKNETPMLPWYLSSPAFWLFAGMVAFGVLLFYFHKIVEHAFHLQVSKSINRRSL